MDQLTTDIIDSMARTLYVEAYATAIEEQTIEGPSAGAGEDWMDVAPDTPAYARDAALMLAGRIEERNGMSLVVLITQAAKADGIDPDTEHDYADQFGHYLVMESLGHGVSWFDDHAEFPLSLPLIDSLEIDK